MGEPINLMKAAPRTLSSRLGFGRCVAILSDAEDEDPTFAPGAICCNVFAYLDWPDRLRLLISGRLMIALKIKTDVAVKRVHSVSKLSVMPPREPKGES